MAVHIPPLALIALRYGAVALAGYGVARFARPGRFAPAVEAEMDVAPEGLRLRRAPEQLSASGRFVKDWRVGRSGARWRLDGTALARLKISRLS